MSSKKYTVRIYPRAEKDLFEIKDYFENKLKTSPNDLFKKFYESVDVLETNPFLYPLLKDAYLNQMGYRMMPVDNFLIFYVVKAEEVQIHRFLYGKRNYFFIL